MPADVVAFRLPGNDQNVQHQIGAASGGRVLPASSAAELATAFAVAAETFTDSAAVRVDVPANLAGTQAVISVSIAAMQRYRLLGASETETKEVNRDSVSLLQRSSIGLIWLAIRLAGAQSVFLPIKDSGSSRWAFSAGSSGSGTEHSCCPRPHSVP